MGQILLHRLASFPAGASRAASPTHRSGDPLGPARGVLFGVAISAVFWVGLAMVLRS